MGRRVSIVEKDSTGAVTEQRQFIWAGLSILQERDGNNTITKNHFANGFENLSSSTQYYYTKDHLGSIREVTDSSGTLVASYDYTPYGTRTLTSGTDISDFGYTGHFTHAKSGLILAPYRAYDPQLGRWLSRDPIAENGGINLYAYGPNNPINGFDPTGLGWQVTETQGLHYNEINSRFGFMISTDSKGRLIAVPLSGKSHTFNQKKADAILQNHLKDKCKLAMLQREGQKLYGSGYRDRGRADRITGALKAGGVIAAIGLTVAAVKAPEVLERLYAKVWKKRGKLHIFEIAEFGNALHGSGVPGPVVNYIMGELMEASDENGSLM